MLKPGVAIRIKERCTNQLLKDIGPNSRNGVVDHIDSEEYQVYAIRLFSKTNPYSDDGCFYVRGDELIEIGVDDMYPEVAKYCENDIAATKETVNKIYGVGGHVPAVRYTPPAAYFKIEKVIYNDPATIVFWKDGTKTVVKACEDDEYDPEKGLAMAISKKALGNKGNYYETFKKALPKEDIREILQGLYNELLAAAIKWSKYE